MLSASAVLAQPPALAPSSPAAPEADPNASTDELTITAQASCLPPKRDTAGEPPQVVSTFPAHGQVVRPGVLYLRVTFNEPMTCKGYFSAMAHMKSPCANGRQVWLLSFDRKTIRTLCHTEASSQYGVRVSGAAEAQLISLGGRALAPYEFSFMTNSGPEITSTSDSLGEDTEMFPPSLGQPIQIQEFRGKH
jgi:hypothetical protein